MLQRQPTQTSRENWQLTDAELADLERQCAPQNQTYAVRMQTLNLYKIEVQANNPDEAHKKAIALFKADNGSAELLRTDYGHSTIEKLK